MFRTVSLALLSAVIAVCVVGCSGRPTALVSRSAATGNAGFYVGVETAPEREAVKAFVLSLTPEQVRKANAYTKANPEHVCRTDTNQGLPCADLTEEQKQALAILASAFEQRLGQFAEAHPEHAERHATLVPLDQSEIFNVGYYYIPEETKDHTLLGFEFRRRPLGTQFETTLPGVLDLPAALSEEGLNLGEWGCRISTQIPPEMESRIRAAEEEARLRESASRSEGAR